MWRFSLLGIPIRVDGWFWLTMAVLGGLLSASPDWERVLTFIAVGFVSILVHEFGHALTGRKYGAAHPQIILHAFGGLAIFPAAHFSRKENLIVTAAGPGAGLLLGVAILLLNFIVTGDPLRSAIPYEENPIGFWALTFLVWVNIVWSLLNLIPVLPLDGGMLVRHLLGPGKEKTARIISLVTVVIVVPFALLTGFYILAVMLVLLGYSNWQGTAYPEVATQPPVDRSRTGRR